MRWRSWLEGDSGLRKEIPPPGAHDTVLQPPPLGPGPEQLVDDKVERQEVGVVILHKFIYKKCPEWTN